MAVAFSLQIRYSYLHSSTISGKWMSITELNTYRYRTLEINGGVYCGEET